VYRCVIRSPKARGPHPTKYWPDTLLTDDTIQGRRCMFTFPPSLCHVNRIAPLHLALNSSCVATFQHITITVPRVQFPNGQIPSSAKFSLTPLLRVQP